MRRAARIKRVHVVEDDDDTRRIMGLVAEGRPGLSLTFTRGLSEVVAEISADAPEAQSRRRTDPELVIVDLGLGGERGEDVVAHLRGVPRFISVPIVVFSSTMLPETAAGCYARGANSCVEKPVDADLFEERFTAILDYWLGVNGPNSH